MRDQGRQFVYGFLLSRIPLDGALERTLAGLGVQLLGPHDSHQKARLQIASLKAIIALPGIDWLGVSAPATPSSARAGETSPEQTNSAIIAGMADGRILYGWRGQDSPLEHVVSTQLALLDG